MDMEGRKLSGDGELPGEHPIHLEILKARPDIGSVIHYHGMYSTAFTTSEHELRPIHLIGTLFHDGIPVYRDPRLVNNRQRGEALAKALGSHRAVLLQAHGALIGTHDSRNLAPHRAQALRDAQADVATAADQRPARQAMLDSAQSCCRPTARRLPAPQLRNRSPALLCLRRMRTAPA